jgi:WhiB family redox-sensing transcriptional regulator
MTPRTARGSYTHHTAPAGADDWRDRAACRGNPAPFFPVATRGPLYEADVAEAKAVCRRCSVVAACLAWALRNCCADGIWGGLTEQERRALPQPTPEPAVPLDTIRDLAARGSSDPEIAHTLGEDWTAPRVAEARRTSGIPAGRCVLQDAA